MNRYFDTSVLIQALVDQLPEHERALTQYTDALETPKQTFISSHSIAECYATLSALPLKRRITPYEAFQLVEESILSRVQVIELSRSDYQQAMKKVLAANLGSGAVYDAIHLVSAEKASCNQIFTFNLKHFRPLAQNPASVLKP
jgi:predicted nucleic acid-binding protein